MEYLHFFLPSCLVEIFFNLRLIHPPFILIEYQLKVVCLSFKQLKSEKQVHLSQYFVK